MKACGVSCYRGELEDRDEDRQRYVIDVSEPRLQRNLAILLRLHTPAWLLAGEEVGTGGDGEPVLKVSRSWRVPGTVDLDADPHSWALEMFLDSWNESDRKALSRKETEDVWRRELGGATWP